MGGRCFVVEEGPNPSTDFFILPFLHAQGVEIVRCAFSDLPSGAIASGTSVLFVRYVPVGWKRWVSEHRDALTSVALFFDDDLFDLSSFRRMPLRYQWKLLRLSWRHQRWLRSMEAQLLVSTAYLQHKYQQWHPQVLHPQALGLPAEHLQTVFYHGSASHQDDLRWLYPVIKEVLNRNQHLVFEVIGGPEVNRLFKILPRVHVLQPMKWPAYQALLRRPGRSIGLAPLLDTAFNRARSPTKFFDITQTGAVGIYTDSPVYANVVRHNQNGLLLAMQPEQWVDTILTLAGDKAQQAKLLAGARACL